MLTLKHGYNSILRRVAQPGSALAWGARGREFESRHADQTIRVSSFRELTLFCEICISKVVPS